MWIHRFLSMALVAAPVAGATATEGTALRLGTGTVGGGFQAYAAALADAVHDAAPALSLVPVATKGSTENVPLLEQGRLDLALVTGEVAREALSGGSRVRVLAVAYPSPALFAVRAERALHRAEASLASRISQGRETTLANTAANVAVNELHPGVVHLLREEGFTPPSVEGVKR